MTMLATYYRPDAAPKVFPCQPGAQPETVDLLGQDGRVVVGSCPVLVDPDPVACLRGGYAMISEIERPAPKATTKKPKAKAADADEA